MMMKLSFVFLLLGIMLTACSKSASDPNRPVRDAGPKQSPENGQTMATDNPGDKAADENVDIPSNISGAFLDCALRKEGKEEDPSMEIGCVLKDASSQKKVDFTDLNWESSDKDGVTVVKQTADALYSVLYKLRSYDIKTLVEKAEALEAIALYKEKVFKREKVYNVLKPAIVLEDYEAPVVREQGITKDDSGSL